MTKQYQTDTMNTTALAVSEQASATIAEIADDRREGLLALAVGAVLQVMGSLIEAEGTRGVRPTRAT